MCSHHYMYAYGTIRIHTFTCILHVNTDHINNITCTYVCVSVRMNIIYMLRERVNARCWVDFILTMGAYRFKLIIYHSVKTMSVKGGVYAHEAYEAIFFCYVNTWDRHRFYTYIYYCIQIYTTHTR
jgi:hypothetical protein